jgi:hypothetical protein
MNVNDTLRQMLYFFPTLYCSQAQTLEQLFIVIGNGYEWENGQLVTDYDYAVGEALRPHHDNADRALQQMLTDYNNEQTRRQALGEDSSTSKTLREILVQTWQLLAEREAERTHFVRQHLEAILSGPIGSLNVAIANTSERGETIYPLSAYSALMNIPDDCQPDWLDAAQAISGKILAIGGAVSPEIGVGQAEQMAATNLTLARLAMVRINDLRDQRSSIALQ